MGAAGIAERCRFCIISPQISPYLPIRRSWIAEQCWFCRNLLGTF